MNSSHRNSSDLFRTEWYVLQDVFFQWGKFRESCSEIWQMSVQMKIPIIVSTFLYFDLLTSVCWSCDMKTLSVEQGMFLVLAHNWKPGSLWWRQMKFFNRPEVSKSFNIIFHICWLTCFRFAFNLSSKTFTSYSFFLPWSAFSEFVTFSY